MKQIKSPIFGEVNLLDENDTVYHEIHRLIHTYPVNAFGIVNKLLNSKGYMTSIDTIQNTIDRSQGVL